MFLHFLGVTPPTFQHFRVAISIIFNTSRLLLQFEGYTPQVPPPDPSETSGNLLLSHAINVETSRMDSGGYQVTPLIRSRRLAMYLIRLQEKSIPPGYFCCSGSNPLGNPGHSEANVSKSALFGCNESRRLSITFVKHEPPEPYLPTHAFFDVQNHIML